MIRINTDADFYCAKTEYKTEFSVSEITTVTVLGNRFQASNVTILEIIVKYPFISSHSNNYFDSEYIYIYN